MSLTQRAARVGHDRRSGIRNMRYLILLSLTLLSCGPPSYDTISKVQGMWHASADRIEKSYEISIKNDYIFIRDSQVDGNGDRYRIVEVMANSLRIAQDVEGTANLTEIVVLDKNKIGLVFTGMKEFLPNSLEAGDTFTLELRK
jgi:hypothetical protein